MREQINGDEGDELVALREENVRLKAEVEKMTNLYEVTRTDALRNGEDAAHLKAENEKLRIDLSFEEARADTVTASNMILLKENAHLRVEIKRLRAALYTANANCDRMASLAIDNAKDTERLREAAKDVCWFDWSDNDDDAVEAIEKLRAALTPPAMNQEGGE